jgi:uncharacterized membrane protein
MAALLALLSSLLWGSGDFLGGTLSRRVHPVTVMQVTQGLGGVALLVIVVAAGEAGRTGAIGWGVAAGALGCIGLGAFYSALATGTMGVVAPVAATGVVIPVGWACCRGIRRRWSSWRASWSPSPAWCWPRAPNGDRPPRGEPRPAPSPTPQGSPGLAPGPYDLVWGPEPPGGATEPVVIRARTPITITG